MKCVTADNNNINVKSNVLNHAKTKIALELYSCRKPFEWMNVRILVFWHVLPYDEGDLVRIVLPRFLVDGLVSYASVGRFFPTQGKFETSARA